MKQSGTSYTKEERIMNTNKELNYRLYVQREAEFTRPDIRVEFSRYDDIRQGNVENVKTTFAENRPHFYTGKGTLSDHPLRNAIYHLVVAAGVIARVCVESGLSHDESYTLSDIYIRKADVAKTPDEVIDLLGEMQIDYATRMRKLRKNNSMSVYVRRAIDYIYDHLHEHLTLELLAQKLGLNPSYFSRLFSADTNTTVKAYINRVKINTAQNMLLNSTYSISDISLSLGFSSPSAFSSVFKKITGITPGEYRSNTDYHSLM